MKTIKKISKKVLKFLKSLLPIDYKKELEDYKKEVEESKKKLAKTKLKYHERIN